MSILSREEIEAMTADFVSEPPGPLWKSFWLGYLAGVGSLWAVASLGYYLWLVVI